MGSVGDCYDNALAEPFWATLERDSLSRRTFTTRLQARSAIFDYIEGFYIRIASAIGMKSPAEFEAAWAAEQTEAA